VQIFNAAPTKLAHPTLREFFLHSVFAPSCLVDATGSVSVARVCVLMWVPCVCHGTKLALLAAQECRDIRVHRMIRHIPLDSPWLPKQLHVRLSAPRSMSDGAEVPSPSL